MCVSNQRSGALGFDVIGLLSWHFCYRLDKWLNCLAVGVTPPGFTARTTHVSYMSHASVRGLVSGCRLSQSVLLGYPNLVSG